MTRNVPRHSRFISDFATKSSPDILYSGKKTPGFDAHFTILGRKLVKMEEKILFIINDGPYGNEKAYNALRLAMSLAKRELTVIRVFLMGDGVQCAVKQQETPQGFYNIERMLGYVLREGEVAT